MIVFTVLFGLSTVLAFVGNLLVLLVVILYRDFHKMRYFLLASLALSGLIFAILVASNRTIANVAEKWIFGTTWCHGNAFVIRVLHHSSVFHLCAVSYERHDAIVRRPLNYSSRITMKRAFLGVIMLWILPVLISFGPLLGWGDYVYNADIFACEQKWDGQTAIPLSVVIFLVPLGVIFTLNYQVLKVVHQLQRSVEIINKGVSDPENEEPNSKTLDYPSQHQYSRDDLNPKQHERQGSIQNATHKMVTTSPQMLSVIVRNMLSSHRNEGEENASYQPELDELKIYQNEVVCERRNTHAAQCLSVCSLGTREDGPIQINKKTVKSGCSKEKSLDHMEKRYTRPQVVEHDQGETIGKMDIKIHQTEGNHQIRYATLEDGNGSQKMCETQRQNEKRDSSTNHLQTKSAQMIIIIIEWKLPVVPKGRVHLEWRTRSNIQEEK